MSVLKYGSDFFEFIFGFLIMLLGLASNIAVPILIVRWSSALSKQRYGRNQPKQWSDEGVMMGVIASGANEEYGVVAAENAVNQVAEHKDE